MECSPDDLHQPVSERPSRSRHIQTKRNGRDPSRPAGVPPPAAAQTEDVRSELQKELQRALDRRQRRQRSQSVSSTTHERASSVQRGHSPDKYPRIHTHPRRPSSRATTSTATSTAKPARHLDLPLPPPEQFGQGSSIEPIHTCGLIRSLDSDLAELDTLKNEQEKLEERLQLERYLHDKHEKERAKLEKERLYGSTSSAAAPPPSKSKAKESSSKEAEHKIMEREMERRIHEKMEREAKDQERRARIDREKQHRKEQEDRLEYERLEFERKEKEKMERKAAEKERKEREKRERERERERRARHERAEQERLEKERQERERQEQERLHRERVLKMEQERLEHERKERERLKRLEQERLQRLEQERLHQERLERQELERQERERQKQERLERERIERERQKQEQKERERMERERQKQEQKERERMERERQEKERIERERIEHERRERERLERERERQIREQQERERRKEEERQRKKEQERQEKERRREKERQERLEMERLEFERLEKERLEQERREYERLEKERLERLERERREYERLEKERQERERREYEQRLEKERLERERLLELEHLERERQKEIERIERTRQLELERLEKERQIELDRLEKERQRIEHYEKKERRKTMDPFKIEWLEVNETESSRPASKNTSSKKRKSASLDLLERERLAAEMAEKERYAKEMAEQERKAQKSQRHRLRNSSHFPGQPAGSYMNGDIVDSVDLMGLSAISRMSNQSEMPIPRPAPIQPPVPLKKSKKKSYDEALSTLAATLPLVSHKVELPPRAISTAPGRGRKSSRTPTGKRSRSNDHYPNPAGTTPHVVQWKRESSVDARLPQIRPASPFKRGKKTPTLTPASPPCTCDEDGNYSRDSRMSRATTTRTAASGGFSSLASSAFQMEPRESAADFVSDAISLEALSPRPRSRSRSRQQHKLHQRRSSGSRLLLEHDYHYHHELDRCRSYVEGRGGLEHHMEFCKCTCNDHHRLYDEFVEAKVVGNSYLDGQQTGNNHRGGGGTGDRLPHRALNGLNGSSRSLASTHPMLTGFGGTGHYTGGHVALHGGHVVGIGGQSPGSPAMGETLRRHLGGAAGAAGTSLSSKVHTVILSGLKFRRQHWFFLGCLVVLLLTLFIIWASSSMSGVGSSSSLIIPPEEQARVVSQLLQEVPLIDGHNDLPWNIRKFVHSKLDSVNFTHNLKYIDPWAKSKWSHTDIGRMVTGQIGCQLWVAYAPCGAQHKDAVQVTLEQIDLIKRLVESYPNQLQLVKTSEELVSAHASGRIASLITVESGHSIGTSLAVLRMFHRLGARSLTLTHNCNTPWADCSKADVPGNKAEHNGLTQFGRTVVEEMNRLGMIVDLSHSSIQTSLDTLAVSDAPVIFSHSSAKAVCNSSRNIPDNILRLVAEKKGLVMVNFFSYFLTCSNHSTIKDVIAHLNHIRRVAGIDHVGLGASYDGINSTPVGLEDVSKYPALFASLLTSGAWSLDDLKKLAGLNFIRVFREVEKVSREYYKQTPLDKQIPTKDLGSNTECKTDFDK